MTVVINVPCVTATGDVNLITWTPDGFGASAFEYKGDADAWRVEFSQISNRVANEDDESCVRIQPETDGAGYNFDYQMECFRGAVSTYIVMGFAFGIDATAVGSWNGFGYIRIGLDGENPLPKISYINSSGAQTDWATNFDDVDWPTDSTQYLRATRAGNVLTLYHRTDPGDPWEVLLAHTLVGSQITLANSTGYYGISGYCILPSGRIFTKNIVLDITPATAPPLPPKFPSTAEAVAAGVKIQLPVPTEKYDRIDQSQMRKRIEQAFAQVATGLVGGSDVINTLTFADILGEIGDAQVPESAVTQYEADLTIDWSQLTSVPPFAEDPTTTEGDLIVRGPSVLERLAVGTEGYVLSVVSGVPAWAPGGGGGLPVTADVGDSLWSDGGDFDILTVGADGEILYADSGEPLGVRWGAAPSGSLPVTTDVGDMLASDGSTFDILPVGTDGYVLTADSGDPLGVSWQPSGGGGGGGAYGPDVPPSSPGTYDDEFTSGPGGAYTISTNVTAPNVVQWGAYDTFLQARFPGGAAGDVYQFWKPYAMAVGDSFAVKLSGAGDSSNYEIDIFLNDGATGGFSGTGVDIQVKGGGSPPTLTIFTVNGGSFSATITKNDAITSGTMYIAIKRTATSNFRCYYSADGVAWTFLGNCTPTFTAASIQFAMQANGASNPGMLSIDWIRSNWFPL